MSDAETQLGQLVRAHAPKHAGLVASLRRALRKRLPGATEIVYDYRDCVVISFSPSERGYEGVLVIRAAADGVRLCLNSGKDLADPAKLLRGSGSQVRWMPVETAAKLRRAAVQALLDEAIARSPVPFTRRGGGVVLSQSTVKKRKARAAR